MAVCQNLVPLVNIKIAGKWMFIPLKMVLIGIDPYPYIYIYLYYIYIYPETETGPTPFADLNLALTRICFAEARRNFVGALCRKRGKKN